VCARIACSTIGLAAGLLVAACVCVLLWAAAPSKEDLQVCVCVFRFVFLLPIVCVCVCLEASRQGREDGRGNMREERRKQVYCGVLCVGVCQARALIDAVCRRRRDDLRASAGGGKKNKFCLNLITSFFRTHNFSRFFLHFPHRHSFAAGCSTPHSCFSCCDAITCTISCGADSALSDPPASPDRQIPIPREQNFNPLSQERF
jgi:hypothetical protein